MLCSCPAALWSFLRADSLPIWQRALEWDGCGFQTTEALVTCRAKILPRTAAPEHALQLSYRGTTLVRPDVYALQRVLSSWRGLEVPVMPACKHLPQVTKS